ncbi:MAG TPA: hypothetical protein VK850_09200, partial [Candidatus Binatia bacterium]|nr:hypothetical protein [Candidatus Binatia bacterium]
MLPEDERAMGGFIGITKVLVAWLMAFLAITGWGRLVKWCWCTAEESFERWLDDFWIGLAAVLCFLQIWNLVLPVNWTATLAVVLIGFGSIIWRRDRIREGRRGVYLLVVCLPLLLRLAHQSLLPPSHYDSGLYHFNIIRWHMEYPVVPGLTNLHGRLGFNQSFFLYVAMLNVYPWFKHGHNIATSLLVAVLLLQLVNTTWRLLRDRPAPTAPLLLRACLLLVLIGTVFCTRISGIIYYTLSSPALDLPLLVWGMMLFVKFADYMLTESPEQPRNYALFELCALAAVGVTMKLSMLVFGGSIMIIAMAAWLYRGAQFREAGSQALLYATLIALLIMCPWFARGVILSGYPIYPATFAGVNVDWQVPRAKAEAMKDLISNWGKTHTVHGSENWIAFWMKEYSAQPMFTWPLRLFTVSSLILACFLKRTGWNFRHFLVWLPPCAAVAFWFMTAPNPRFAGPALWLLALWPTAGAAKLLLDTIPPRKRFIAYCALAAFQVCV